MITSFKKVYKLYFFIKLFQNVFLTLFDKLSKLLLQELKETWLDRLPVLIWWINKILYDKSTKSFTVYIHHVIY